MRGSQFGLIAQAGALLCTGSLSRGERAGVRGEHYRDPSRVESPYAHFSFVRFVIEAIPHRFKANKWKVFMRFLTASHWRCTI